MKRIKMLTAAISALLAVTLAAGCGLNAEPYAASNPDTAVLDTAVDAVKEVKPAPSDRNMNGMQGLVVRANADELAVSRFWGTTVSDVILTVGAKDPSGIIKELNAAGIKVWLSVNAVNADDNVVAAVGDLLGKYDVNGIELDFLGAGASSVYAGDTYSRIDAVNAFVKNAAAKVTEFSKLIAVRVAGDITTNYNLGLDVISWVDDGNVSMVSPSSGSGIADTTMPARLWYSALEPYDVILAPSMGAQIKPYSSASAKPQLASTFAGEAAMLLSMGADKVCVDYAAVDDASLKILGSYNQLLATDRRVVLTYTDFKAGWQASNEQLPKSFSAGQTVTVRIPVGDVSEGSTLMLNLGVSPILPPPLKSLTVVANSKECTPVSESKCEGGYTNTTLYGFSIPAEVIDEGHIVAEIVCNNGQFSIIYAEIVVDAK